MKTSILLCLLISMLQAATQAAVVGISHMRTPYLDPNTFTIAQEFSSSDGSGFPDFTGFTFISLGGGDFEYGGSFVDEGASLFFVVANDTFSESNIIKSHFGKLSFGVTYSLPTSFFLGIRTPAVGVNFGSFSPAYGWAEFQNLGTGQLLLVDHAVAYSSQGIFVNTTTAIIPEPRSLVLGSVALGLLLKRRRA